MSVDIILSTRTLELNDKNQTLLNLKAVFNNTTHTAAFWKIKTNAKDTIDVRPSYGILRNLQSQDSTASLNIRYQGAPEQIKKMRLQVSWVSGQTAPQGKTNHDTFTEYYTKYKQFKEGMHMLSLSKDQPKIDSLIFQEKQKQINTQRIEASPRPKDSIPEVQSIASIIKEHTPTQQPKGVSLKWVILGALLAFLFGVLVGMKVEQFIYPDEKSEIERQQHSAERLQGQSPQDLPSTPIEIVDVPEESSGEGLNPSVSELDGNL